MSARLTPREAELLLGGHAAGTLTDPERTALFQAALDHQEVFDALMDEEALRELLADPAARAQLLAALAEPAKVVPFWRRHPGALGLAASLLIAVTAGVAYWRTPEARTPPEALPRTAPPVPPTAVAPTEVQTPATPPATRAPRQRPAIPSQDTVGSFGYSGVPAAAGAAAPETPVAGVPSAGSSTWAPKPTAPPAEVLRDGEDDARAKAEIAKEKADQAGVARSEERRVARPAAAPKAHGPDAQNAFQNNVILQEVAPVAKKVPGPSWSLEAGGKVLVVHHPAGHTVVLLRRSPRGPVHLRPRAMDPAEPGLTRFDLGSEPGPWDLYVVTKSVGDPLLLPEAGPFEGTRIRIPAAEPPAR